jgi:hypothetical protein
MTYLELVNAVLIRLRENEVTSVSQTSYTKLIGALVNDAKGMVQNAADWSGLRTTVTATTTSGIFNYALTGSQNNLKILNVINDTSNIFMNYQPATWMDNVFLNSDPASAEPKYYSFNGVDMNGDTLVDIYPIPDGVYSIRFNAIIRNTELVADTDQLALPSLPVLHLALALAARERGETGGTSTAEYFSMANNYLADAIALDLNKNPEQLIFREV